MARGARTLAALALAAALAPARAPAQDRPSEEDLFGAPPPRRGEGAPLPSAEEAGRPGSPPPSAERPGSSGSPLPSAERGRGEGTPADARGDALLGGLGPALTAAWDKEKEDPLKIGGLLYWRAATAWGRGQPPAAWGFTAPALLDVFLDARPNDRVRAFALGRLTHDPTVATSGLDLVGAPVVRPQSRALLDQAYLNFDVARAVFVTAGKQHVKWGTGRIWNPADFLHPVRRDPLSQFDDRTGVTMLRAHLPWEARGWNLYAVALADDLAGATGGAAAGGARLGTLGGVGGAARAEVVVLGAELAASAAAQRGHAPRWALDGSFALWDLDLHAEAVLAKGRDAPAWRATGGDVHTLVGWERARQDAYRPQVVAGVDWSARYSDEDALTLGLEYFSNGAGYDDAHVYPVLIASPYVPLPPAAGAPLRFDRRAAYAPFYLGRHYLAASLHLPRPGRWNDTTFNASAIANLSDGSAVVRLDHSVLVNTYLTVETFLAGHLGKAGGEFRFGLSVPPQDLGGGVTTLPFALPVPVLDAGVALRVKL